MRNRLDFLSLKKGLPNKKLHCHYILVLSKNFIIKFREIFNGHIENIGSFKLNFFSKKNTLEEKIYYLYPKQIKI